jgi:CheY-like chemotaxis protein
MDILVVDDDEPFATFLASVLQIRFPTHHVHVTFEPNRALEVAAKNPVQFVVTDYQMQGMSGTELAKVLKQKLGTSIRVVLVTGDPHPPRDSVDAILKKPFPLEKIYNLILEFLQIKNEPEIHPSSLPSLEESLT